MQIWAFHREEYYQHHIFGRSPKKQIGQTKIPEFQFLSQSTSSLEAKRNTDFGLLGEYYFYQLNLKDLSFPP